MEASCQEVAFSYLEEAPCLEVASYLEEAPYLEEASCLEVVLSLVELGLEEVALHLEVVPSFPYQVEHQLLLQGQLSLEVATDSKVQLKQLFPWVRLFLVHP